MAKKKNSARKPGGAAGIATYEEVQDTSELEGTEASTTDNGDHHTESPAKAAKANKPSKPTKATKAKKAPVAEPSASGNVGVGDIRKAAAFANAVGGLDKAISLLQILKVAKEVQ